MKTGGAGIGLGEYLRCWVAAAVCWAAAWSYWVAWRTPEAYEDGAWIKLGVGLLVAEFIAIHSSTLVGELAAAGPAFRRFAWAALAGYALFALAIPLAFDSIEIGLLMGALMLSRLHDIFRPASGRERAYGRRRSLASAMLFLTLAFATLFLPIGPGGITPELLDAVWPDRGDGVWEAEPQRALVMGLLYFLLLGLVEVRPPSSEWAGD